MAAIVVIAGTRPEAIKLAPVILALRATGRFAIHYLATGQHRNLFDLSLGEGPAPDANLGLMEADQQPTDFLVRAAALLKLRLAALKPALVIVQGDTASAYAGAMAAYRLGYPVAHVEAGLRTHSITSPFPEELFRRAIAKLATLHFAPTARARDALIAEGVRPSAVHVTGNTGVDNLFASLHRPGLTEQARQLLGVLGGRRFALATVHRRENRHMALHNIATALARIPAELQVPLVLPLHPSPELEPLLALKNRPDIHLLPSIDHISMVQLLDKALLVLTDSGGLQEEAATLGVPVVILRHETERMEAVQDGRALVAGNDPAVILSAARTMLDRGRMAASDMFGNGHAGRYIASIITQWVEPENHPR